MREWSEIAARSDRATRRNVRHESGDERGNEQLDGLDAGARVSLRERVRPEEHRPADDVVRIGLADAARVAPEKPQLKLGGLLGWDRLGDEAPEAGVDAVRVVADLGLEERACPRDSLAPARPERDRPTLDGDVPDVGDRQIVASQLDRGRHAASLDGGSARPHEPASPAAAR